MITVFAKAANGKTTCTCNSIRMHSAYDPNREAERFAQTVSCDFNPSFILITGVALSYCAPYLKKRFPCAKLCAVHYTNDFTSTDYLWDKVFVYSAKNTIPFSEQLYNYMGEEGITSCLFASWQPSEKAFAEEHKNLWQEIKQAVLKSRDILATRTYFAKRWVCNAVKFCMQAQNTATIQKGSSPIIVCASGPSLKTSLPFILRYRECFFLIAVSSALKPLVNFGIIPDLCISTDGGYWAKLHIARVLKDNANIPLALPPEAACPTPLFSNTIVPLSYGDGIAEDLLNCLSFKTQNAKRNGTVSGTAAELALELTSGQVFFCGLDLSATNGFAHTQPNENESYNSLFDFRLKTIDTRITPSTFFSPALELYASWFKSKNFNGRLFRLSDNYKYQNTLGEILDINWDTFKDKIKLANKTKPQIVLSPFTCNKENYTKEQRKTIIKNLIENNKTNPLWIKEILPADEILLEKSIGTDNEYSANKKLNEDLQDFYKDILDLLAK